LNNQLFVHSSSIKSFGEAQDKICRVQPIDGIPNMFLSRQSFHYPKGFDAAT
jgi:hypothetical protein